MAAERTLVFLPHCEAELCDGLLAANAAAGTLRRLAVLGNSLRRGRVLYPALGLSSYLVVARGPWSQSSLSFNTPRAAAQACAPCVCARLHALHVRRAARLAWSRDARVRSVALASLLLSPQGRPHEPTAFLGRNSVGVCRGCAGAA